MDNMVSGQVSRRTVALNIAPVVVVACGFAAHLVGVEVLGLAPADCVYVMGPALVAAAAMWGVLFWRGKDLPFASWGVIFLVSGLVPLLVFAWQ